MKTIALRLDPETRKKLELLAEATGCSRERLVAEAVQRFVEAELEALAAILREAEEEGREAEDGIVRYRRRHYIV